VKTARSALPSTVARLRELTRDPGDAAPTSNAADVEREFQALLQRGKLLAAIVIPFHDESALAHRFGEDLRGWRRALDRQSLQLLQEIGVDLVGVLVAITAILAGAVVWRVAVTRYVADGYRRRLLMTVRNAIVLTGIVLVVIFHFTTELTALVTALGFAAAGIAFALQNVILAIAGYFSMVAPNGIRVGDRVSLQGPFGYVHGEVLEIGFVRIRLRELTGDPPRPTGRVVVFPNSVVFTGSFFKEPPSSSPPATRAA
jgi:small-conductance mechanosensitive channel